MARRLGATDEQLAAVRGDGQAGFDRLEAAWAAAMRYADDMTLGDGHGVDGSFSGLARHWQPPEIVEITMVIGLFAYFNRFNNALCVEPTR